jgi:DNA-directed RNA polymerase I subunit RPA43
MMASEKHKSKSEKRHKSSHGENKRKRSHEEDGHHQKSKKLRANTTVATVADLELNTSSTPFSVQTSSLYLSLSPISQKYPVEGLCAEHLSPLILQWYPPFNGVILSYSNPRISEHPFRDDGERTLLQSIDEYAVSWAWVTAEFLLFKPHPEAIIEGYVNLQNEGHLGLVCWNLFNASIERKRLPPDWKWVGVEDQQRGHAGMDMVQTYAEDGAGYFVDGDGEKVDGMVKFRIIDVESDVDREKGFLSLAGTMLDAEAEEKLEQKERARRKAGKESTGRGLGGLRGLGVTRLGVPAEKESEPVGRKKQRQEY